MTNNSTSGRNRVSNLIKILLIDDDSIYRLGFCTALESYPNLQVVAEVDTATAALEFLGRRSPEAVVNLVVLELLLDSSQANQLSSLQLCQQLKVQYPSLPVLLLAKQWQPRLLVRAKEAGADGYCPKGASVAILAEAMEQVASGNSYWQELSTLPSSSASYLRSPRWHIQLRHSGLGQIEQALELVEQKLQKPKLSNWDWLFWSGRRRELLAARWVVNQLLPSDILVVSPSPDNSSTAVTQNLPTLRTQSARQTTPLLPQSQSVENSPQQPQEEEGETAALVAPASRASLAPGQSVLFDATTEKLHSGVKNLSGVMLEIEILQAEKRRDLLYIVLRKFEEILDELRFSQVKLEQLPQKRSQILLDLWQISVIDFFGKYSTLSVDNSELEVVELLLGDALIIQNAILDKIPLVTELLAHLLFKTPLVIDNVPYQVETPEALARLEILLHNLVIQVANAVMQPLLNNFADLEIIKQSLYDRSLISSREIARFRNNLSWKYRQLKFLSEPQAIFESRYELLVLSDTGIKKTSIYAPRRRELEQLQGIQLAVTLAYELRDAISPRLRATVAWIGSGVVYILTQVIGKGIGLIVRGVIQGVGSSLQETRFGRNSERWK
ncbi:MAG: DUF3685 domain-containing protein [Symploca sp. SIO1C4]|uniref:DUF3685 domain-containing protein n=1 Tax=Symploca sp. SIO1C4 TaxID=2607765 RepID=A0A6B3N976_9CYAN|nr:DUF3685 domain-containing protein [Symploca sp. SIO1C4]